MPYFELSAHMTVRPGQLDGFKRQAAEIIRLTKEKDTRTLRYDWFLSKDGTECEVRELYTDPDGLIEHKAHVGPALKQLFAHYADNHFMTIYGEPSQPLLDLVHSLRMEKQVKWFAFVEGIGAPDSPPR
jgi:quinol monooxygenase YgiN